MQVTSGRPGYHRGDKTFLRHVWDLENRTRVLAADNHEWLFELVLPGDTSESIEGIPNCWIIYRLKATIDRGFMQQNVLARKHVRIIRTLGPSDLELSQGMVILSLH